MSLFCLFSPAVVQGWIGFISERTFSMWKQVSLLEEEEESSKKQY
jgi:hypothetical protein